MKRAHESLSAIITYCTQFLSISLTTCKKCNVLNHNAYPFHLFPDMENLFKT